MVAAAGISADSATVRARLVAFFEREPGSVLTAYLFGSVARGEQRADSDVDVGVLLERDPPHTLEAVPAELESRLTHAVGRPVEVVVLNGAPVDLAKRVLRDGILVADRDPSRRIAFEVRVRNEYWDLHPVLRRYRDVGRAGA